MSSDIYNVPDHNAISVASTGHSIDDLKAYSGQVNYAPSTYSIFDGEKFAGGFGITQLQDIDYWTLRKRSSQLFNENLYAKGIVRRLVTNEINTGLTPESTPDEMIIGVPEDSLNDWTELTENRFGIWGKMPNVCDFKKRDTFGAIQREARREALIDGDILVIMRISQVTGMPMVQLIKGDKVQQPLKDTPTGNDIVHGIEIDKDGRHVAFWVIQDDGSHKRIPAYGSRTKRRTAWMVYGTEKRMDEVRGQPLLAIVLQSLKEIDRYRDSTQRKAVNNSVIAGFIEKTEDKMSTLPVTAAAVRKDAASVTDSDGTSREFNITNHLPGAFLEELQTGEKPVLFNNQGTDTAFSDFEAAIIHAVAWANEMPPEILTLAFSNNYSASQAAINEFKIYLNMIWSSFGESFCTPIYIEHLIAETLSQRNSTPKSFLDAWRDPQRFDEFGAWTSVSWYGSIKPSTDMLKQAKGSKMLVDEGWSTNARESRITTGTKFSKNIKRVQQENEMKADAARPMLELAKEYGTNETAAAINALENAAFEMRDAIEEITAGGE